jgi:RNA polymerase sigma factor (sigma-70 family)
MDSSRHHARINAWPPRSQPGAGVPPRGGLNLQARLDHKLVQRDRPLEDHSALDANDPHQALAQQEQRAALAAALAKLPERQRAALLLVHYEGLSYREAAESIDASEGALKSLIHRARTTMAAELEALAGPSREVEHAV